MNPHVPSTVEADTDVKALTKQAEDVRQLAAECAITDTQALEWATALLGEIARAQRAAEARRVFFVKPLNDHVRAINDFFKLLAAPLVEADHTLRRKVLDYRKAEQERAATERARLEAERTAAEAGAQRALKESADNRSDALRIAADEATAAMLRIVSPPAATVKTVLGTTTARRIWDYEVTNLAEVPLEYHMVDAEAVRAAIRRGVREIPGVRIFEREVLAVSTRS